MTESQYQTLLDGLKHLDHRLDGVDQRLDQVDQRLDQVDRRFDRTDETVRGTFAELHRHFDVVAEGLEHKIALVAEGLVSLRERFEEAQRQTAADFALVRAELRTEIRHAAGALVGEERAA